MSVQLKVFDDELLSVSRSGTVWGRVYFDLGDRLFPEEGWSDLAVAFVASWLEALIQIASAGSLRERVHFMDGPLAVAISANNPGVVNLAFTYKDVVQYSIPARFDELLQNAISAGNELAKICERHGWSNGPDYVYLTAAIAKGVKALPV